MIDYTGFLAQLESTPLSSWLTTLSDQIEQRVYRSNNGNLPRWLNALEQLPHLEASEISLNTPTVRIGLAKDCPEELKPRLEQCLRVLMPWRKGPFEVFGIHIDTEWRSDWKWNRLKPHVSPLSDRLILDVGCGSGYHGWRMLGEGARLVAGIDPSLLYVCQYQAIQKYAQNTSLAVLPFKSEDLPGLVSGFDTVFSMGVLYHRRSPLAHLQELYDFLRPGGELVLETLVVDGDSGETLIPKGRYAKMNNVWRISSSQEIFQQLTDIGFAGIRLADINRTTTDEQRSTDWMQFESLKDFLDSSHQKTIEGYPAPIRGLFIATRPE